MAPRPSDPSIVYCKWCGANDHFAGRTCPRSKTKRGSKEAPTGSGDWIWDVIPDYSTWHSTIAARKADAELLGMDGDGVVIGHLPELPWASK